ncbi:hypothetical protein Patl1_27260 [Pistacia atlantica]|uniref:Uncharacterized protein n=1 Tax=Pistacia atlantica TaxID=434234 RepID=A0ACC1BCE8_9ROSI|nr:hypothetical protein Patl1_27260 [Pistacia atlantica]
MQSRDVFNKFKDSNGNFKASLVGNIRGVLSLYEATHLRVHGETILDEALVFTTTHLEPIATELSTPLAAQHFPIFRWDISAIDQLPDYMQITYATLLDVYNEIETEMTSKGQLYPPSLCKRSGEFYFSPLICMKTLVRNYFIEAKWCHENYVPTMDEYMSVALVTSAYQMLATTSFVGMGDVATIEAFECLNKREAMLPSGVECFMKQYDATEEEANNELQKQVTDAWKDVNEELLRPIALANATPCTNS